jgi:hypothetical protein
LTARLKNTRNLRAKTPDEMLHLQKIVDTDDEEEYRLISEIKEGEV